MVFESLVANLLNRFLGSYVQNFDSSKLKLGIWGGDVVLKHLDVKETALDDLDLPVKVASGHLGKLVLKIPYKNIYTSPTTATIEGLYVVVIPNQGIKYDAEKEAKAAEAAKQAELQRIEEAKTKVAEKSDGKEDKKDTFTEKLVTQIIKNLQVTIKDIHLRYEDNFSDPRNPFSLGFTLHNLSFDTTNEKWEKTIIQENISVIHKLVSLDSLSVYWNSKAELYHLMTAEDRQVSMERSIATSTFKPDFMKYMIGPINSHAQLIVNSKPEIEGFKMPKVWLNVVMEEIVVGLSRYQYQDLIKLLESLDRMTVATLYRKYRPDVPKIGHPKEWWHFAITAILEEDVRRKKRNWSWQHMKEHLERSKRYKELYVKKLLGKKLTTEMTNEINDCEKELDLFNITIVRKQAELEAQTKRHKALRSSQKDKETQKTWGGWFGSFFSSGPNDTAVEDSTRTKIAKQIEEEMTPEEKQKLYEAIGYHEQPVLTEYPEEFVENKLLFLLHNLTLVLSDDTRRETQVFKANLKEVSATVEQRPAAQGLSFDSKIDSFIVQGVPSGKAVPTIASSRQFVESNLPLLSIFFEMNPLDKSCDQKLHLQAQPLQITYDATTINSLIDVFKPPEKAALQQLQATAMLKLEDLKEMSAFGLQYAIEQHKYLDLKVDMQPIFIIIPEKGVYRDDSHLIVISLGNFKMVSHKRDPQSPTVKSLVKAGSTEEEVLSTMIEKAYDKFEIGIRNVEVILTTPMEDWKVFIGQTSDTHHILYPLSINIDFHKSIVTIDPRMPQMKIVGILPLLDLGISDLQLSQLIKIATSIPLPESDAPSSEVLPSSTTQNLSSAVAADYVNSKAVQQVKREAVQNVKNASIESDDDSISQVSVQSTSMEMKFEVEEFSFSLFRRVKEKDVKMLKFAFTNFGTTVCSRTFDMTANLYLGGILLESFEYLTSQGANLKMISTAVNETETNLFTLTYLAANKKAPDFESVYHSTLQMITADFKAIDFVLHQEAILSLMDFSNTLLSSIQSLETPKAAVAATTSETSQLKVKSSSSSEEKSKAVAAKPVVSKKKAVSQIIDTQLNATLESIRVVICNKKYDLTDIKIKGMNASVTVQKSKTSVSASLKDMIVSDPTPKAVYPQIISTLAGEVLDVKLVMFNNATDDENYINMDAVDMSVTVSFGRTKIIFLNKFVSSLLLFLDHFQTAKDKVAAASAAAAEVAKQSMEEVYEKSTRILLNIVIEAPVIMTPKNSSSDNTIVADLGILKIQNVFSLGDKRNELGMPAIYEKMTLDLQNLQMYRAVVKPDTGGIVAQCLILDPISFTLDILRNHSSSWHTEQPEIQISGRLAAVKITMSQEDYNTVMSVLSENLAETAEDVQSTPAVQTSTSTVLTESKAQIQPVSVSGSKEKSVCDIVTCKVHARFKFEFILDSVKMLLCQGETHLKDGISGREATSSIAEVEVYVVKAFAVMMSDSSMTANVLLQDLTLEDTRSTRKCGVTKLMCRSDTVAENMIAVHYEQSKTGEKNLETIVSSFGLIFCLDYIMMLGEFFSGQSKSEVQSDQAVVTAKSSLTTAPHSVSEDSISKATDATRIKLKVHKPDIVLIENIEDENSSAIFLNNEIDLNVTIKGSSQSVSGSIKNLTFYTACFASDKRAETSAKILSPCDIDIQANLGEHSQHMDIIFNDLVLHISPGTVNLLTNILSSIVSEPVKDETEIESVPADYSNIWDIKPLEFNDENWYLKNKVASEAIEELKEDSSSSLLVNPIHQQLLFTMRKIIITIEAGIGTRTVPMLLVESSFQADIKDWASNLYIGSSFSIEMSYYNEKIAVWEPLIEPVETAKSHRPWELMMELSKEHDSIDLSPDEEEPEEIYFAPPEMKIHVVAQDVLELTVSKACLDVLTNLGEAFKEAVSKAIGKEATAPHAPYHVNNYLGIPVNIILSNGIFQILNEDNDYNCVKLESGCPALNLTYSAQKSDSKSRISVLKKQDTKDETYFNIMIVQDDMNIERKISVACTDKRFFQLPRVTYPGNRWGFIISIHSLYGSKFVTFHSILQVHNHFSVPIDIYFMKDSLNEVEWCACAEPNKTEHIPLHAVYTVTSELFFKPKNLDPSYTLSLPPFVWKDLTDDPSTQKIVYCKDKMNVGKPFYMSIAGEAERIYYEETNRKTMASSAYKLNLTPTAVLRNLLLYPIHYSIQGVDKNYILTEGESNDLWAVDLEKTGIEIRLLDYLDRNWACYKVLKKDMDELSVWVFESASSERTLHLELGMHVQKVKGSVIMQLYAPFCMINKTGQMLSYRRSKKYEKFEGKHRKGDDENIIPHPAIINPVLFSFKAKAFFAKKKASLKIADSEWSDKFSLDAVGSSGTVIAKSKEGKTYAVGVQITLSKAGLTKMITFTPFYLLVNNCKYDIEIQEVGDEEWVKLPKEEENPADTIAESTENCIPFWPKDTLKAQMIVRYFNEEEQTKPFSFKEDNSVLLQLKSKRGGIKASCQLTESSVITTFEDYKPSFEAGLLVNNLKESSITFSQGEEKIILEPQKNVLFAWAEPLEKRILKWSCGDGEGEHDLMRDGLGEFNIDGEMKGYWVSFLNDMQRVLMFTDDIALAAEAQEAGELEQVQQEITLSLQGLGMSFVNNDIKAEVMYIGITSTGIIWEGRKKKSRRFKPLSLKEGEIIEIGYQRYNNEMKLGRKLKTMQLENKIEVNFEEMLMTKPLVRVLRRTYQTGLWVQYKTSPHQLQLHAKINRLQIDNMLMDCVFPVVLAPVAPPKSVAAEAAPKPFTELSVMLRKAEHCAVPQFKYCKILIQEFHIKLDQGFINSILLFFAADEAPEIDHVKMLASDKEKTKSSLKSVAADYSSNEQLNYYDNLHFSPLKVHISFSMTGGNQDSSKPTAIHSDFLNLLLQSVGVTLTEIQDVVFRLDYFERRYVFLSQSKLMSDVISHYSGQALKQMYMLVLGLDVIGNPVGLLLGIGEGVTDLFYEPFQGAIQGPEEFAEGLALGVKSLFGHAIGGAAGAASRITGTLGKGIAALTLDKEYQKKRRQNISRRPQDFAHGIAESGKGLVMGVFDGVTGIVTKPIEGAREGGVGGFFKGFGKGLIGVVTRPTAGVVDFASGSFDAVKRVTQVSDEVKRLRIPRFIQPDGIIRAYVKREAEGNRLLLEVEKGKYANTDVYQAHAPVSDDKLFLLVTNNRVMYIEKGEIFGLWNTVWEYRYEEIKEPPEVTDKGLRIMLVTPQKKGLFSKSVAGKMVYITNPQVCQWIANKITDAMKKRT